MFSTDLSNTQGYPFNINGQDLNRQEPQGNGLADKLLALQNKRKNSSASHDLADKLLSMGGPFTAMVGAYFAGKARREDKYNEPIDNQIEAVRGQLAQEKDAASRLQDYAFKNLLQERAAQKELEKERRKRQYDLQDRDFNAKAAKELKMMDIMANLQKPEQDVFEKELNQQRAKQYAQLSADIAEDEASLIPLSQNIEQALRLNKIARAGGLADTRQAVARFFGGGEQTAAGAQLQGIMQNELVGQLKKIFGGQISEGERAYLDKLYAADLSMSEGEREALIRNVYQAALNRVKSKRAAFEAIFPRQGAVDQAALEQYNKKYGL